MLSVLLSIKHRQLYIAVDREDTKFYKKMVETRKHDAISSRPSTHSHESKDETLPDAIEEFIDNCKGLLGLAEDLCETSTGLTLDDAGKPVSRYRKLLRIHMAELEDRFNCHCPDSRCECAIQGRLMLYKDRMCYPLIFEIYTRPAYTANRG